MAQLAQVVEPFGEVNVHKGKNGCIDVVATILMVPEVDGARVGVALDGSASMKRLYGVSGIVGGPFSKAVAVPNLVEPVAQTMVSYLANFSSTGKCDLIYWAVDPDGSKVEPVGEFSAEEVTRVTIGGPKKFPWGRGTRLLPAVRHFLDQAFRDAPWTLCIFITDGVLEDLEEVKSYCLQFARQIAAGQRGYAKLVLIGLGEQVNEKQMEELDDMFEGSGLKDPDGHDIDLWDHKLAAEMRKIEEIFAEVVTSDTIVTTSGRVLNQAGQLCHDYPNGLPALLRFTLPAGSTAFTLEFPNGSVTQDLSEGLARL